MSYVATQAMYLKGAEDGRQQVQAELEQAKSERDDAVYWCQQIRRITGEPYAEPRDAYRTACQLSERLQRAEQSPTR